MATKRSERDLCQRLRGPPQNFLLGPEICSERFLDLVNSPYYIRKLRIALLHVVFCKRLHYE